jgi:hypothetical protein
MFANLDAEEEKQLTHVFPHAYSTTGRADLLGVYCISILGSDVTHIVEYQDS